jgi:tight adherence protein B
MRCEPLDARLHRLAAGRGIALRVPPTVLLLCGALLGGVVMGIVAGPAGAVAGAVGGSLLVPVALLAWPDQLPGRAEEQVPAFVEAVARSLRGGRSLVRALGDAAGAVPAPLAADARALVLRIEAGVPVRDVLGAAAAATRIGSWRTVLIALSVAHEAGGPQALVLDAFAASLRARQASARELASLSASVRLSACLIALAPLAVFGGVAALDPALFAAVVGRPVGVVAAVVGVLLDAAGFWWIRSLTRPR